MNIELELLKEILKEDVKTYAESSKLVCEGIKDNESQCFSSCGGGKFCPLDKGHIGGLTTALCRIKEIDLKKKLLAPENKILNEYLKDSGKGFRKRRMNFLKYPTILRGTSEFNIKKVRNLVPKEEKWCVLERLDGRHFQICYDGEKFKFGGGKSFLSEDQHVVLLDFKEGIKKIYENYKRPIRLYGEIFGGEQHGALFCDGQTAKQSLVRRGVEYCPKETALFFDLIIGDDWVPYKQMIKILKHVNIPFVPVLQIGCLDEVLKYPNDSPSQISSLYGLPIKEDNVCGGIIIKPYEKYYGVSLKSKSDKFKEIKKRTRQYKRSSSLQGKAGTLLEKLQVYTTKERFNKVFSKQEYDKRDFGMFLGNYVMDVLEEAKNDGLDFEGLEYWENKRLNRIIGRKSKKFVEGLFFNKFI